MPTIDELITATQVKLDAVNAQIVTWRGDIATRRQQVENAEARRALLKTRLEALQVLNAEAP